MAKRKNLTNWFYREILKYAYPKEWDALIYCGEKPVIVGTVRAINFESDLIEIENIQTSGEFNAVDAITNGVTVWLGNTHAIGENQHLETTASIETMDADMMSINALTLRVGTMILMPDE